MSDDEAVEVLVGVWATLGDARLTAELERLGFDWVGIDAQHGHFDDRAVRDVFSMRHERRGTIVVRVAANDPTLIGRALDAGADGVIVPLVDNAAQAAAAVRAAHYPPKGARSWGPLSGQAGDWNSVRPLTAVMIETREGLDNAAEICGVDGVDMVFVGPFDLSLALGLEVDTLLADRTESSPLGRIVASARAAGILAGAYAGAPERAAVLRDHGFTWIAASNDLGLLTQGASATIRVVAEPST